MEKLTISYRQALVSALRVAFPTFAVLKPDYTPILHASICPMPKPFSISLTFARTPSHSTRLHTSSIRADIDRPSHIPSFDCSATRACYSNTSRRTSTAWTVRRVCRPTKSWRHMEVLHISGVSNAKRRQRTR